METWALSSMDRTPSTDVEPIAILLGFCGALRTEGLSVSSGSIADFCRASMLVPEELYWAGLATLVSARDEIGTYDRVFNRYFAGQFADHSVPDQLDPGPEQGSAGMGSMEPVDDDEPSEQEVALASRFEVLKQKTFADCSEEELRMLFRVGWHLEVPISRSRRYHVSRSGSPDLRRTVRASFRTAGEPISRAWRVRSTRERRVVLLLDVSGSMSAYSRALLHFAHAGVRKRRGWEVFCFATRLNRLSPALSAGTPEEAVARAADQVVDWGGGTRIGESLKFLRSAIRTCSAGRCFGSPGWLIASRGSTR